MVGIPVSDLHDVIVCVLAYFSSFGRSHSLVREMKFEMPTRNKIKASHSNGVALACAPRQTAAGTRVISGSRSGKCFTPTSVASSNGDAPMGRRPTTQSGSLSRPRDLAHKLIVCQSRNADCGFPNSSRRSLLNTSGSSCLATAQRDSAGQFGAPC